MSKFDELKKLAEAATPGVWDIFDPKSDYHTYGVTAKNGHAVVYFGGDQEEGIRRKEDADFIAAANPVAVLNLLVIQEQLVAALQDMLSEKADYMTRNKLGDPAFETVSIRAMAVLAAAGEGP